MIWRPHKGPQERALRRQEFEVLFGGMRGGGKTDTGIVAASEHFDNPRFRALIIRKNSKDLTDWVDRARIMYNGFNCSVGYQPPVFKFPSGAKLVTGHLNDANSYTQYQGQEFQYIGIEELTQIPTEKLYMQLISSCRSTIPGIKPRVFATTNPGGVGHGWVKKRFIEPSPPNKPFKDPISGRWRIYIPAGIDDNPTLMQSDPDYVNMLESLKDVDHDLYMAWRHGDWNVFAGQYFKFWHPKTHVIRKLRSINPQLTIIGGLDWGRTAPFSFHLAVIYPVSFEKDNQLYKFYRTVTFLEVYGVDKTPGEWSHVIKEAMRGYDLKITDINRVMADNRIFVPGDDKSIAIADQFYNDDAHWQGVLKPGSKDRIGGWENMQNWMSIAPDGMPYWLITDNNINLIEEIPNAVHDVDHNVEDLIAEADHALDESRYMLKDTKWIDAKASAIRYDGGPRQKPGIKTAIMDVDLDAFASPKPGKLIGV